jgi:hypothetical protein
MTKARVAVMALAIASSFGVGYFVREPPLAMVGAAFSGAAQGAGSAGTAMGGVLTIQGGDGELPPCGLPPLAPDGYNMMCRSGAWWPVLPAGASKQ